MSTPIPEPDDPTPIDPVQTRRSTIRSMGQAEARIAAVKLRVSEPAIRPPSDACHNGQYRMVSLLRSVEITGWGTRWLRERTGRSEPVRNNLISVSSCRMPSHRNRSSLPRGPARMRPCRCWRGWLGLW